MLNTDMFTIKAYAYNNNVVFMFNNDSGSQRLANCHITKVEVA